MRMKLTLFQKTEFQVNILKLTVSWKLQDVILKLNCPPFWKILNTTVRLSNFSMTTSLYIKFNTILHGNVLRILKQNRNLQMHRCWICYDGHTKG